MARLDEIRRTSVRTSDGAAKSAEGHVYWAAISAGTTGGAFQLNDSTDDSGTDLIDLPMPEDSTLFLLFDPPLHFGTGIYVDIPGTNVTVNLGYD